MKKSMAFLKISRKGLKYKMQVADSQIIANFISANVRGDAQISGHFIDDLGVIVAVEEWKLDF